MAEELGAAMGAASDSSLLIAHPWLLWGGCSHWTYPSRKPETCHTRQVPKTTPVSTHLPALLGTDNKTYWEFRDFSKPCQGL